MEQMWWPSPDALKDLEVSEDENGLVFSAPDGTECGDWLNYYDQTFERQVLFAENVTVALKNYLADTKPSRVSKKYRCTVTGFESSASGLTRYQKNRNIDISNRTPVTPNG